MHTANTHHCTHCQTSIRPQLRHVGRWPERLGVATALWFAGPLLSVAAGAASRAGGLSAQEASLWTMLALALCLGLALWATARLLLDLAAPRVCPECGAPRPVRLRAGAVAARVRQS